MGILYGCLKKRKYCFYSRLHKHLTLFHFSMSKSLLLPLACLCFLSLPSTLPLYLSFLTRSHESPNRQILFIQPCPGSHSHITPISPSSNLLTCHLVLFSSPFFPTGQVFLSSILECPSSFFTPHLYISIFSYLVSFQFFFSILLLLLSARLYLSVQLSPPSPVVCACVCACICVFSVSFPCLNTI